MLERMKIALFIAISDRLMDWKQWLNRFGRFNSRDNLEHKAEHNNCRMRRSAPESSKTSKGGENDSFAKPLYGLAWFPERGWRPT
jgi:hypothetical protein